MESMQKVQVQYKYPFVSHIQKKIWLFFTRSQPFLMLVKRLIQRLICEVNFGEENQCFHFPFFITKRWLNIWKWFDTIVKKLRLRTKTGLWRLKNPFVKHKLCEKRNIFNLTFKSKSHVTFTSLCIRITSAYVAIFNVAIWSVSGDEMIFNINIEPTWTVCEKFVTDAIWCFLQKDRKKISQKNQLGREGRGQVTRR